MTFAPVETGTLPAGDIQRYAVTVLNGVVHVLATRSPNGEQRTLAAAFQSTLNASEISTAISTVGDGVLTAAGINGRLIIRSGSTAAFSDTTATAALIQAAWVGGATDAGFEFLIQNTTAFAETLVGGTGVTLAGVTVIPANSVGRFFITWAGTDTVTITGLQATSIVPLPNTKIATALNATTGSLPAGAITGAERVFLTSTNATPGAQLVRTAAQMLADITGGRAGMNWTARIINTGAGVFTLTADGGATVTLVGTMTIAQNTWRDFVVSLDTVTTATITAVGTGTTS